MAVIVPIVAKFDPKGIKQAKGAFAGLSSSLKKSLGGLGIGLGLAAVVSQLDKMAKGAVEDAKSQAQLAVALRNVTGATQEQIAANETFIAKTALASNVLDSQLRPALATLVRATGDVTQAQNLLQLSLDVSAGTGKELQAVTNAIGKAYAGNTGALAKLVPGIQKGSGALKDLQEQFKGASAAAAANDPYGTLKIAFDQITDTIGAVLLPVIRDFANWIAQITPQVVAFFNMLGDPTTEVGRAWLQLAGTIGEFGKVFIGTGDAVGRAQWLAGLFDFLSALTRIASGVVFILNDILATFADIITLNWGSAGNRMGTFIDRYNKFYDKLEAAAAKPFEISMPKFTPYTPVTIKTPTGSTKAADTAKAASDAAAKAAKELADELKKQQEALADFKTELLGLAEAIQPLQAVEREIGEFERAAVTGFDNIVESIKKGLADNTITEAAAKNLQAYVKTERIALEAIARQRDELANKRSLVEALIGDVKAAVAGYADITNLLDTQTRTVEQTISRTVGSLTIATKRSIEEVVSGNGLVGNLKDVVTRTKAFALQLKQLRELGLDQNLYKQIVDAGIEAGSATAAEIIKGGAGTVTELNSLFKELNDVGTTIAEETASVMYNNGVLVAGGLVAGLKSQEAALVAAATSLANAFTSTYNSLVGNLQTPMESQTLTLSIADIAAGNTSVAAAADMTLRNMASTYLQKYGNTAGAITTITVNAGVGTNGKAVGQAIYNELAKYNKSSLVK